jgi:multicomponent Na+:H+ antiporter subunit D
VVGELTLVIALPLVAALLALPLRKFAPWFMAGVGPASLWLAWETARSAPATHAIGGWEAPLGIALRADGLAAAFVGLGAIVATSVGLYAIRYFGADQRAAAAFWPLFFALWGAINTVFLSHDLFNLYVALELVTLPAVAMVALEGRTIVLVAAVRYLLFALFGSLAFLLGTALLYSAYGTLDIGLLRGEIRPDPALMTVGLLAKTALFPFSAWLPSAHSGAPAPASALLSALVVKASFYILFRFWFDALPALATPLFLNLLGLLGSAAVIYGAAMAMRQSRLKLVVAYSTVAQLGYLFLVFPLLGGLDTAPAVVAAAWSGTVFHGLAHGLAKAAMFLAAGTMIVSAGGDRIANMAGLGKSVPVASFAFGLAAVSLMGLPPSGGFLAKYLLLKASFASGQWWWGAVLVAGGLLTAIYLFRPLNQLMRTRDAAALPLARVHWSLQAAPLALALAAVALGLASSEPYRLIHSASPIAAELEPR